jgi:hypothetical protein
MTIPLTAQRIRVRADSVVDSGDSSARRKVVAQALSVAWGIACRIG